MKETFEQYIDRILSYAGPATRGHRRILTKTPAALARRVKGATRSRLTRRPQPGKWSARDILAHLADIEVLWGFRIRLVLGQSGVPLIGMDQDVWAKRYRRVDPRGAFAAWTALRRANRGRPENERLAFSYGIGYGDVLEIERDVFGLEVNLASKLGEDRARRNEALLTPAAAAALPPRLERRLVRHALVSFGDHELTIQRLGLGRG